MGDTTGVAASPNECARCRGRGEVPATPGKPEDGPMPCPDCAPECQFCGGDGWYIDHEDECYETGDCNCSGVQMGCDACGTSGFRATA